MIKFFSTKKIPALGGFMGGFYQIFEGEVMSVLPTSENRVEGTTSQLIACSQHWPDSKAKTLQTNKQNHRLIFLMT